MKIRVGLPDLYRTLEGKTKKRFAWSYLQRYHPEYDPLPEQPELESENVLLCTFNFDKARQISEERLERMNQRKKKK